MFKVKCEEKCYKFPVNTFVRVISFKLSHFILRVMKYVTKWRLKGPLEFVTHKSWGWCITVPPNMSGLNILCQIFCKVPHSLLEVIGRATSYSHPQPWQTACREPSLTIQTIYTYFETLLKMYYFNYLCTKFKYRLALLFEDFKSANLLIHISKLVKNDVFVVKNGLFICKFMIWSPKWRNVYTANNEGNL